MIEIITYKKSILKIEQIKEIINNQDYTYIVATRALERERYEIIPDSQKFETKTRNENGYKKIGVFSDVMRQWVKKEYAITSRGEEKTVLHRAIKSITQRDKALSEVLKKDVSSWARKLSELESQGIKMKFPMQEEIKQKLVNEEVGRIFVKLQEAYELEIAKENKFTFEKGALQYLKKKYKPSKVIIMEGFTFLTDLQAEFIKTCDLKGVKIYLIVPYNPKQNDGFKVIEKTYEIFKNASSRKIETNEITNKEDLEYIQSNLFSDNYTRFLGLSTKSISMYSFPSRERELSRCIDILQGWFDKGYKPEDVAVVMRSPKNYMEQLYDCLAVKGLSYMDKDKKGRVVKKLVEIDTPSRLLLLTPLGKFVLTLYDIWEDGKLKMEPGHFETILSSGWLGAEIQDTATIFSDSRYEFFEGCETKQDWINALELIKNFDRDNIYTDRIPAYLIFSLMHNAVELWTKTIDIIEDVCKKLFNVQGNTIGNHIKVLQDELNSLFPEDLRRTEMKILEKINKVFNELKEAYSISLTTSEFGDVLHAIASERKEDDTEEDAPEPDKLWVTSPEGIDGIRKKCVIYVGVDDKTVPAICPSPWPFFEDNRDEHLNKERYMFLTVLRSTTENLVLSYSKKDGEVSYQPGIYLKNIEHLLGIKIKNKTILDSIDVSNAPALDEKMQQGISKNRKYTINELVHFGLCPQRYCLEILHPAAKVYRNDWQVQLIAQGVWLDKTFEVLGGYFVKNEPYNLGEKMLFNLLEQARIHVSGKIKKVFPAFDGATWFAVEQQVKKQLKYHAEKRGQYKFQVEKGEKYSIPLLSYDDRSIQVEIDIPWIIRSSMITYPVIDPLLCSEWLLPGEKNSQTGNNENLDNQKLPVLRYYNGMSLFADLSSAVRWWRDTITGSYMKNNGVYRDNDYTKRMKNHFDNSKKLLVEWINGIEHNIFPASSGQHCRTCPVRQECLGMETGEMEDEREERAKAN